MFEGSGNFGGSEGSGIRRQFARTDTEEEKPLDLLAELLKNEEEFSRNAQIIDQMLAESRRVLEEFNDRVEKIAQDFNGLLERIKEYQVDEQEHPSCKASEKSSHPPKNTL